jgi:hypothetical protein
MQRSWDIPVWNRRESTRKRTWKLCGAWRWIRRR